MEIARLDSNLEKEINVLFAGVTLILMIYERFWLICDILLLCFTSVIHLRYEPHS